MFDSAYLLDYFIVLLIILFVIDFIYLICSSRKYLFMYCLYIITIMMMDKRFAVI